MFTFVSESLQFVDKFQRKRLLIEHENNIIVHRRQVIYVVKTEIKNRIYTYVVLLIYYLIVKYSELVSLTINKQ